MPVSTLSAVVLVSVLHSALVGWIVYALMRRNETRQQALVTLYDGAVSSLKDYFAGTTDSLSGGMQRLLEIGAAMSQGQAQVLQSVSQTLSHDHAAHGLRLLEALLPVVQQARTDAKAAAAQRDFVDGMLAAANTPPAVPRYDETPVVPHLGDGYTTTSSS